MTDEPQARPTGAEDDPLQVEIQKPITVKPNGRKAARAGMHWITVAYILLAVGTALGLFIGFDAARTARRTASQLQAEVTQRCIVSENSRSVLREEHIKKLQLAQKRLKSTQAFGTTRPIPAGFTKADVDEALQNAKEDIAVEKALLRRVEPVPCKT